MCGIFGYIGKNKALPFILEGLKKLEYRGYDSAGIATLLPSLHFNITKCKGKISDLEELLKGKQLSSQIGIGHTRWATHGRPSDENSHPHLDQQKQIALVHNGIIDNYLVLRRKLAEEGQVFESTTDTEVLAHLIGKHFEKCPSLEEAVRTALREVEGSYAIAVLSIKEPDKLVVARKGSPLIIGLGDKEAFVASDIAAIIKYTSKVIYLGDGEVAVVKAGKVLASNLFGKPLKKRSQYISWDPESAEKSGYSHFMLKEIHEQPKALRDTMEGRVKVGSGQIKFEELKIPDKKFRKINRIIFTSCGTSWHASLIGEYLMEQFVHLPCEVEYAAELRYRYPVIDDKTLVIAISQSGETADTLGAIEEAKAHKALVLAICNVRGSSITRLADGVIYTKAGPEIGVASTKAFTTQLLIVYLFTLYLSRIKGTLKDREVMRYVSHIFEIPQKIETLLLKEKEIDFLADKFYNSTNALYLGRGKGFPIALEGALKLKEVSYIHAEGYPAAEMKHGPIALIDQNMPVVVLALTGRRYDKILGNIEEVKARGGNVIAIASEGDDTISEKVDEVVYIPNSSEALSPILAVIPLQLLAYYIAVKRGCHVDQPRNLAKSVTVE